MTKSRLLLTFMCIIVAGVLAGCGGHSGGSTTTTGAATTKPKHSGLAAAKIAYEFKMQKLGTSLGNVLAQVGEDDQRIVSNSTSEQISAAGITVELRIAQKRLRLAAVATGGDQTARRRQDLPRSVTSTVLSSTPTS